MGLRWDLFTPWSEVANRYSIMDPSQAQSRRLAVFPALTCLPEEVLRTPPFTGTKYLTTNANTDYHNFAPRLGMAWKATNRIVLRGGYGISYYPNGGLGGDNVTNVTDGFSSTANFICSR